MPTAYTMVTADVTVSQFQSLQPMQPLRFFLRYSKEGHAGVLLSSIGTHYAGITFTLVARKLLGLQPWFFRRETNAFQYFWIAIYIGTYGYLRGSSTLVLSCFLYYSLRTSARPKYSGHDVNAILNLIKILLLSVNLSITR